MSIGQKIKYLRESKGLSQDELSEKIGVSRSMISLYEKDVNKPKGKNLIKIAEFFQVPVDYFKGVGSQKLNKSEIDAKIDELEKDIEGLKRENQLLRELVDVLKKNRGSSPP